MEIKEKVKIEEKWRKDEVERKVENMVKDSH